ncbi:MAG: NAD-dependent epimerase/dehydratase family protein [Pyrinomonadaceae bacterium]
MNKTALVTGASGAIGFTLTEHLLACGYKVRALVRNPSTLGSLRGVEIVQGEINDAASLRKAVAGVSKVFHLAAKLHINNPSPTLHDEYRRINVDGTRSLVEAARDAEVERFIFFSTINVYGPGKPEELISEESPLRPDSFYAQTKVEGERITLAGTHATVLRLAAVYGPRMKGNYPRLLSALRRGRFLMIGDGGNRRTLVYVKDVCEAALLAAEHPLASGQTYNVTDGEVHSLKEIIDAMSDALGRKPPKARLPELPVRLTALVIESSFKLFGKSSPVGRATVEKFLEDIAVSGEKIQKQLGFRPRYDLQRGWRETVRQIS